MTNADMDIGFVGIGSGKCGSTWLYRNLVAHPQICDCNLKELNYFSDLYDKGPGWYAKQFAQSNQCNPERRDCTPRRACGARHEGCQNQSCGHKKRGR